MAKKGKIKKAEPKQPNRNFRDSPIQRMKRRGTINVYEVTAADELLAAYQMTIGVPVTRDPDLGIPPAELRHDAADAAAARRSDLLRIYPLWKQDLRGKLPMFVTQSVVLGEMTPRQIDADMHWKTGTARDHLLTGLRHFAALRGNTPRGARNWKVKLKQEEKAA